MALSTGKVAGLLGAVLLIALLAFSAGFLLGLDTAAGLRSTPDTAANAGIRDPAAGSGGPPAPASAGDDDTASPAAGTANGVADAPGGSAGGDPGSANGAGEAGEESGDHGGDAGGDAGGSDSSDAPGGDGAAAVPGYQVLAGVHAVAARADAMAQRLALAGFAAQVVALDDPGGPWFRVVVGGFDSLARAREAAMQIRTELGVDALVGPPPPQAANADADG
jgi:hypothetical protein